MKDAEQDPLAVALAATFENGLQPVLADIADRCQDVPADALATVLAAVADQQRQEYAQCAGALARAFMADAGLLIQ